MKRFPALKFAVALLALAIPLFTASAAFAQASADTTTADEVAKAEANKEGLITIILGNIDPVFITIVVLSIFALTLIIQSVLRLRKSAFAPEATTEQIRSMIEARQFKELIEFTENDPGFISRAINPALKRAPSFSAMKEAMETSIGEQTAEQFRKIEYLNIIGNLGPLLGLLGTVLGMIDAFSTMKAAGGNADPSVLAGGISKALAHTFMGLFLAVPALGAFGVLRTFVDRLTIRGALDAEDLLMMIKPEGKQTPAAGAPRPVAAPAGVRKAPVPQPPSPANA